MSYRHIQVVRLSLNQLKSELPDDDAWTAATSGKRWGVMNNATSCLISELYETEDEAYKARCDILWLWAEQCDNDVDEYDDQ